MYIRYLTPEELETLDPTGQCAAALSFGALSYEPASPDYDFTLEDVQAFLDANTCEKHLAYYTWNRSYLAKWGRQGGTQTWEWLYETLKPSYENAQRNIEIPDSIIRARDYLLTRIRLIRERVGYPQLPQREYYHTAAGLPTGGKKGYWTSETAFDCNAMLRHLLPSIPGHRCKNGKHRLIYQSATSNVRLVERQLKAVRLWLRQYLPEYFSAWLNPDEYQNFMLTQAVLHGNAFLQWDYYHMDEHVSSRLLTELVLPVYSELLLPRDQWIMGMYFEECMDIPLFLGDRLITGSHNLFSGEPITNDVETILSVILALASYLETGGCHHPIIAALGDDLVVSHRSRERVSRMREVMLECADRMGLVASPEKCEVSTGMVKFCKKLYVPAGAKAYDRHGRLCIAGAYPSVLTLLAIRYPERLGQTPGLRALADLQRLDNCAYSPDYHSLVQFVGSRRLRKDWNFTVEDSTQFSSKDWWYRLYGENFNPEASSSFAVLKANHLVCE